MANTIIPILKKSQKTWNIIKLIYYYFNNNYYFIYYSFIQQRYTKIVREIQKKDKIKVAFFLIHDATWKYEGIYELMKQDNRFDPVVIVCPFLVYGEETLLREMDQAYTDFSERGYHVIKTFNKTTNEWLDVKHEIKPDIIFFTNPHKVTKDQYSIKNFLKTLTCYVPYTFQTTYHYQQNYNGFFHNVLWKAYYPTNIHFNMAVRFGLIKGINGLVTGYPAIDRFLNYTSTEKRINHAKLKKKIIWAPHHTIDGAGMDLNFSNFLRYYDFMIQIAEKYKNQIFITFKPHPALRPKLSKTYIWGKEKTDAYYNFWKENDFCALNEGNYQSLFIESDAMIHDCDSFMGEYLSLNKPVLYTIKDACVIDKLNEFGQSANDVHYHAKNEQEIVNFIEDVVISEMDKMRQIRTDWIKTHIIPPNNKTASMNIFEELKASLNID